MKKRKRRQRKRRGFLISSKTPSFSLRNLFFGHHEKIILRHAKRKKEIIYGGQAMKKQIPAFLMRFTGDFDIYTRRPKRTAHKMQKRLDKKLARGQDDFYAKPAKHRGTHKVMHEGADQRQRTKDDIPIVDYTIMPRRKPKTVRIGGVMFASLSSIRKKRRKILQNPKSKYRHKKDKEDLRIIRIHKKMR